MKRFPLFAALLLTLGLLTPARADDLDRHAPKVSLVASGLGVLFGTAVGPGNDLYVAENDTGRILRLDVKKGKVTTFASGVPTCAACFGGGPYDVAFIGNTAYVLVTLVDSTLGGNSIDGIYRVDGPNKVTLIADIGQFALTHPPKPAFEVPTGLQFALEPYKNGFLVTDGHHNRVYYVTLKGEVSEVIAFDDIVPTGLARRGNTIYMAEAGPVPHLPQNGKIVAFVPGSATAVTVASGARLLVDVEFGPGDQPYALSQGQFPTGGMPGDPALPNTGALVQATKNGTFTTLVTGLNQPTSMDFIGDTAYVTTLNGEIWAIKF